MAASAAQVWIQDDGELGSLRVLLEEMEIDYLDAPSQSETSAKLMISTPRYALERGNRSGSRCPCQIVIAEAISNTMKSQLQRLQCDYIIEEPVHPSALQLLIMHSLYRGPERRKTDRVALTESVRLKIGWRSREGTLIQLSNRGCQVICDSEIAVKEKLVVQLAKTVSGKSSLNIRGHVVSSDKDQDDGTVLSIAFGKLKPQESELIRLIMKKNAVGDRQMAPTNPALRAEADRAAEDKKAKEKVASASQAGEDRRKNPRAEYEGRVLASSGGQARGLIGRDLSVGGMLVDPEPGLQAGDNLKLVIYGRPGVDPVVVKARLTRDDGQAGLALEFYDVSSDAQGRLASLISTLPAISCGPDGSAATAGKSVVVSKVVERVPGKTALGS